MPKIKVRAGGQIKLPTPILTKYRLREGDIIDIADAGNGIVFIPEKVKQKAGKQRLFDLIEKAWTSNRAINSTAFGRVINRAVRVARDEERKALGN